MLAQTHKIISEHVHSNVKEILGVDLNKFNLIYGSIKPDIAISLAKLDHFKPQSFDFVCNNINDLSSYNFQFNKEFIKQLSTRIGVVTHFISDFFCVPHNDRLTYQHHFIEHVKYEHDLHKLFKNFDEKIDVTKDYFNLNNNDSSPIKTLIDDMHLQYQRRGESLLNDVQSSIRMSSIVALFIIYNSLNNSNRFNKIIQVA
ncbi:zinc dependent phospholipase C family protein [Alkaliphilus oremlandii]|uniref:Phospholipase C/D domain-containing protein n=1 Tax=Alkaliphilus oremlandii (strain OhILAs) TaxID=350688 RepID=A8MHU0_ALKOO|nr:zinc dependent phospholipase C family protein [Alkaliphilus oremlandii]ABW19372.1 conserved hypothetical protein [Alkaliphilus oremlandii OhILAs]